MKKKTILITAINIRHKPGKLYLLFIGIKDDLYRFCDGFPFLRGDESLEPDCISRQVFWLVEYNVACMFVPEFIITVIIIIIWIEDPGNLMIRVYKESSYHRNRSLEITPGGTFCNINRKMNDKIYRSPYIFQGCAVQKGPCSPLQCGIVIAS